MREWFRDWTPSPKTALLVETANAIVEEYQAQGYVMTLRQLYYQLVARGYVENTKQSYKRIGEHVNHARLAGLIDWAAIVDDGRVPMLSPSWRSPASAVHAVADAYRRDRWRNQPNYVEVWVEKGALARALEPVCDDAHVRLLACRGYASATALYDAAKRLRRMEEAGRAAHVLYFGDHDPSGLDMDRDAVERVGLLSEGAFHNVRFRRVALTREQIAEHAPAPNPAKLSDSRVSGYVAEHGADSWELDALPPDVLSGLVRRAILDFRDPAAWKLAMAEERAERAPIRAAAERLEAAK